MLALIQRGSLQWLRCFPPAAAEQATHCSIDHSQGIEQDGMKVLGASVAAAMTSCTQERQWQEAILESPTGSLLCLHRHFVR